MSPRRKYYQNEYRRRNMAVLCNDLRVNGPLSRAQLASRNNLTKATVSAIIEELVTYGFIRETTLAKGQGAVTEVSLGVDGGHVGVNSDAHVFPP